MKKALLILCSFILLLSANAQSNFKPGYLITNDNDTVYGFVDYRTDQMNAEMCRFRQANDDKTQIYSPEQINGYRFIEEGKFYVSPILK